MEHPHSRPRYRLYLDESGDHSMNLVEEPAHRFLSLLGVWFESRNYVLFADALDEFKRRFFGPRPDHPVILHRSDIINCKGPFHILRDPDTRTRFNEALAVLIGQANFHLITVIIDKKSQPVRYAQFDSPFGLHPYHFCLAAILFRYSRWLLAQHAFGDVMAESRGKQEDLQLKSAYRTVYEAGTNALSHEAYQRALSSKDLKLQSKHANIAGLELADMLAHPVKTACLHAKGLWLEPVGPFGQRLYSLVESKFVVGPLGKAEGTGWTIF